MKKRMVIELTTHELLKAVGMWLIRTGRIKEGEWHQIHGLDNAEKFWTFTLTKNETVVTPIIKPEEPGKKESDKSDDKPARMIQT